jgi:hypothetical protein
MDGRRNIWASFLAGAYLDHCDAQWENLDKRTDCKEKGSSAAGKCGTVMLAIESEQAQVQVHEVRYWPVSTEQMPAYVQ